MDNATSTPTGEQPITATVEPSTALPPVHDFALPPHAEFQKRNASYGALISIIIILAIVVVGAFYSWGKRIEQNNIPSVINEELPGEPATTVTP